MGPSEDSPAGRPLTNSELAQAFGCSLPYITKLRDQKAMPEFFDVQAALEWRQIHAPPRGRNGFGKNRVEIPPQLPPVNSATGSSTGESSPANNDKGRGYDIIDIKRYIKRTDDFDGLMLKQAEAVPQIAYGLMLRAGETGNAVEVSAAVKNWGESGRVAAVVREKFLETQEKARTLLPLDEVEDVIGTGLQEIRNGLLKHDDRVAAALMPHFTAEQVGLIRKAVADDIDTVFQKIAAVPDRTRRELVAS